MRQHRLRTISYIPQGAMNSLNPVQRIGRQMQNAMIDHGVARRARSCRVCASQRSPASASTPRVLQRYPHELSGGMKQRVCIAMAILLGPKVIIADEPTSALDVVTQRQVMQTLGREQQRTGAALILIGHDMGLMAQFVHRLAVMYAGAIVEIGTLREVLTRPRHPYTRALIDSIPKLQRARRARRHPGGDALAGAACRRLRLPSALRPCASIAAGTSEPALDWPGDHRAACHLAEARHELRRCSN